MILSTLPESCERNLVHYKECEANIVNAEFVAPTKLGNEAYVNFSSVSHPLQAASVQPVDTSVRSVRRKLTCCTLSSDKQNVHSVMTLIGHLQDKDLAAFIAEVPHASGKARLSRPVVSDMLPNMRFSRVNPELIQHFQTHTQDFSTVFTTSTVLPKATLAQHHLMFAPAMGSERQAFRYYQAFRKKNPSSTAVFLVPALDKVTLLFQAWTQIELPKEPQYARFKAFTDFSVLEQTVKFTLSRLTMAVSVVISGTKHAVLLDSGASGTAFVTQQFCTDKGFTLRSRPKVTVAMGDNTPFTTSQAALIPIRVGHLKVNTECYVIPEIPNFPIVLGDPWLQAYNAVLDFGLQQVTLTKGNQKVVLKAAQEEPAVYQEDGLGTHLLLHNPNPSIHLPEGEGSGKPLKDLVSSRKVARMIRKDQLADLYLVMVDAKQEQEITPPSLDQQIHDQVPGETPSRTRVRVLLLDNKDLMRTSLPGPNQLPNQRQVIPLTPGSMPTNRPMFRYSPQEVQEMNRQVSELLQAGMVTKSTSPFGAPILFVKKKDGTLRMCVDYRGLNKITIPNKYPLPRIDDLLDRLQGAKVFSSLDLLSAYHQIKLTEEDAPKTAFRTPFGLYEYKVMPFGLTNAPSVFMAAMNDLFQDLPYVAVYLDDILIFSKDEEEHVSHIKEVLDRLKQGGYFIKLSKCDFFKKQVKFLGHIVSDEGLRPDMDKIKGLMDREIPRTVYDVRAFLGLANYFRRFIHKYADIAAPLVDLLKGSVSRRKATTTQVKWTESCQMAYHKLIQALTEAPTLRLPDFTKPFQVITDASDRALGAILCQEGAPVAFESAGSSGEKLSYN